METAKAAAHQMDARDHGHAARRPGVRGRSARTSQRVPSRAGRTPLRSRVVLDSTIGGTAPGTTSTMTTSNPARRERVGLPADVAFGSTLGQHEHIARVQCGARGGRRRDGVEQACVGDRHDLRQVARTGRVDRLRDRERCRRDESVPPRAAV